MLDIWSGQLETGRSNPAAAPTELDLSLIEAVYEAIAASTCCGRCGAKLGRRLHTVPSSLPAATPESWRLLVVTRCHGWLRHAYAAEVTEVGQDLRIGQFAPV